ncbi:hypothetical protein R2320_001213 [Cronobacter turicensis]|nr:hypothetical protein [Cronobacter turicensis]
MKEIFQKIDNSLTDALKGMMDVSSIQWGEKRQGFIDAFTINREYYEDMCVFEFKNEEHSKEFQRLVDCGLSDDAHAYGIKHGRQLPPELAKKFEIMFFMSAIGSNEYSQLVADDIYTSIIKKKCCEPIDFLARKIYLRENSKEIAKKPRNKYHEQAINIAKATWQAYPGASMGKLCEKLRNHFNGGVSLDTLERWIKAAKIRPPKPEKYTSFSLVIPPSA